MKLVELRDNIGMTGFVPWKDDLVLPALFEATIEDDGVPHRIDLSVRVERGCRPVCARLELTQPDDGPPVTAADLRSLRLNAYVGFAVGASARRVRDLGNGSVELELVSKVDVRRKDVAGRRRRVSDDEVREVAAVYRAAVAAGEPPRLAVEEHFDGMAPASAARRISAARAMGYLEPVKASRKQGGKR
jgi:hypothetical protein